jgi:phytoene dehydrogenase-like protein
MDYDLVIIGGGPDGLAIGAYMARAGMKCLIVERNNEPGGSFITEDFGGFRFNIASAFVPRFDPAPVKDLELEKNGYRVYRPEKQLRVISGGRSITLCMDERKTAEEIEKSSGDAAAFLRLYDLARETNERFMFSGASRHQILS